MIYKVRRRRYHHEEKIEVYIHIPKKDNIYTVVLTFGSGAGLHSADINILPRKSMRVVIVTIVYSMG